MPITKMLLPKLLPVFHTFFVIYCYKMLFLFPYTGKSHFISFEALVKGLAEKGHQITIIGHYSIENPNITFINVHNTSSSVVGSINLANYGGHRYEKWSLLPQMGESLSKLVCEKHFSSPSVKDFVKSDRKFDVILTQIAIADCFYSLAYKFKAPLIGITPLAAMNKIGKFTGSPSNPSYVPDFFMGYSNQMSFLERVENSVILQMHNFFFAKVAKRGMKTAKVYFGNDLPSFTSFGLNMSLVLVNMHFSFDSPKSLTPSLIEVGGIHIAETKKLSKVP